MSVPAGAAFSFAMSALIGVAASFAGLYVFGLLVGALPNPPRWIAAHPALYVPALRTLIWLPIVVLCAFLISRLARSKAVAFGIVAGLFGACALLFQAYASGYSALSLGAGVWVELALLLIALPLACVIWRPRVA
jgi:hypothetical protein